MFWRHVKQPESRSLREQRLEVKASEYIPYTCHVDDQTVKTVEGNFLQVIRIGGFAFETEDQSIINHRAMVRNSLLRSFNSSDIGLYAHTIRRKKTVLPEGAQPAGFARDLSNAWKAQLSKREQYVNELYLTVVHKQGEGAIRSAQHLFTALSHKMDDAERRAYEAKARVRLGEVVQNILSHLRAYDPRVLRVIDTEYGPQSEVMSFLGFLLNLSEQRYSLPNQPIAKILPNVRPIFHDSGIIEIRRMADRLYGGIISIKEYNAWTAPSLTNDFLTVPQEFILTQSFRCEERALTQSEIQRQQGRLRGTHDKGVSQTEELDAAMDEALGDSGFGLHHFTIMTWTHDYKNLNRLLADCSAVLGSRGITGVREDVNLEAAYYAQLPANWKFITRAARISTKNFSHFVSLHNYPHGRERAHWGPSVTVLQSSSGTPYHFNFHVADRGNTQVIGPTGSGKTLTSCFLFSEMLKYGGRRVLIDKDRGMEIFIRAVGGAYFEIRAGQPTGWNPLHLDDTPLNRAFLTDLYRAMLTVGGETLTTEELLKIDEVVASGFDPILTKKERRLRHVAQLFGVYEGNNLAQRLRLWYGDGRLSWMFDNEENTLDIDRLVTGFDMTDILDDTLARRAALLWLFHNVELMLDGQPFGLFLDEAWKSLSDPIMCKKIENFEFVIRKRNGFVALATQAPESIIQSEAAAAIKQQSETAILFPNPRADRDTYRGYLDLSEKQFKLLKEGLSPESRCFLVKNSHETVLCRLDMNGMDDFIAVLSGNKNTVQLLDKIRAEVGDDPAIWLPIFNSRRKTL
ncbi:VirB4 family type IV secretion/conjugal transfer ATPase [Methylocaldum sp. RMAD-M]|uniref:VirB4 family type IV secretion/conjugal transfer ATPase n=1 Tax=Methylocaldum sp. RMAD-M TaxID=2806557 RepID=UPI001AE14E3F|nr:VirB4 family type IV secretion/conjugal transfer ATPase [Methylocaldum sp. RMAD-M]MBP1152522.1 type IV secretion system protein VirB4 [Methylocaldum sp. RMAD-M]